MSNNITISIDVTLLQKERFKTVTRKNGSTAKFAELVLVETPDGQYGDFMVKQSISKEEREAKVEMPILGNGRYLVSKGNSAPRKSAPTPTPQQAAEDSIPF